MKLSVIISNRNDNAMLAVTVRSALEELKAVKGGGEIVICDNSDEEIYKQIAEGNFIASGYFRDGSVTLLRQDFPCLFTARETAIKQAKGQYICCIDSHMIIGHNMFKDLVDFMNSRRNDPKVAFAHAPISWLHHHASNARHDRDTDKGELGGWGLAYDDCRRISWKGMPWICRKSFWREHLNGYGALAKHKVSWGGGDMHIGVKPWLLGFENWAVPTSPAIHIGPFAMPVRHVHRYRLYNKSGTYPSSFGFLLSCYILGGTPMVERNRDTVLTKFGWKCDIDAHITIAQDIGQEEKDWLDSRKIMTFDEFVKNKPWEIVNAKGM